MSLRELADEREELDRTPIDVQALEAQHGVSSATHAVTLLQKLHPPGQRTAVHVGVAVNVNVDARGD
jgi:hypothetical protein